MDHNRAKFALAETRFSDLRHVGQTGSTNADVRSVLMADAGSVETIAGAVVLVADHQTAGRGRLDRSWEAPDGSSILMSIGLPVSAIPEDGRTLVAMALSLAVIDAIASLPHAAARRVRLKWPNDLVVPDGAEGDAAPGAGGRGDIGRGYRKMGGVLAELIDSPSHGLSVVLGLGLNINWGAMPDDLADLAISLDELTRAPIDRWDLVARILARFDDYWLRLLEDRQIETILDGYRDRCSTIGSDVRVEKPTGSIVGRAVDVTHSGALVVEDAGSRHVVTVGEIIHLRPVV